MTSEEWGQQLAEMSAAERAAWWSVGDVICGAITAAGSKKARAHIFRQAASVLQCSASTARTRAKICATFRGEHRLPDVDPSIYRACIQVAKAMGETPHAVLTHALGHNLHVREILALATGGRSADASVQSQGTCGECGAAVRVSMKADAMRGHPVWCPICEGQSRPQVGSLA